MSRVRRPITVGSEGQRSRTKPRRFRGRDEIGDLLAKPLAPGLYLVATPIGNLADMTLRALSVLARADIIYCEDTRHSAKLLQHYAIAAKTRPFHEHNEQREIERAISDLEGGKRIAMISDAGTPLLSDPGSNSFAPRRRLEFRSFLFLVRPLR